MIQYCKRCCLPSTKPHLAFDEEGICNACRNYENRKNVDWDERKKELMAILDRYRSKDGSNWDCIIPVSGGKDSTYQVVTMLELGMNPLCVTATTCDLTDIGRRNIENIKKMGVDYIEVTTNRIVRAKLNRIGLLEVGDISWPEHVSIFTVPVRMAVNFNIPLIIWGENSQNEYGGPAAAVENNVLDRRWLEEFGGMLGLRVNDLVGQEGITKKDLIDCSTPDEFCFSLCCMECKTVWKSTPIRFSKAGKKPENENRKIIYDTLYDREKNLAFQKALNQAKEIFNICPICKRLVCDHCFLICDDLDMCVQCAAKLNEKGTVVG